MAGFVRRLAVAMTAVAMLLGGLGPAAEADGGPGFTSPVVADGERAWAALQSRAGGAATADGRMRGQVVGGTPAASGRWPAAVSVNLSATYDEGDDVYGHLCGGTLITPRWVLTAAHCVTLDPGYDHTVAPPEVLEVLTGRTTLSSSQGVRHRVDRVLVAQGWAMFDMDHDLALIRLATPSAVPPVRLFGPANDAARPPVRGTTPVDDAGVWAMGWGLTSPDGTGLPSDDLMEVAVPLWSAGDCGAASEGFNAATSVCAGPTATMKAADTCFGDSGGPLMRRDPHTGEWGQIGLVSYAVVLPGQPVCAMAGRPTVYTWVAAFADALTAVTGVTFRADAPPTTPLPPARRIAGQSRYETNVAASTEAWPDGADHVVLATGAAYPDALAGSPAAALLGGPLLLTRPHELPTPVAEELERLSPTRVTVLGGTSAVRDEVVARVAELTGAAVARVSGSDRYATAVAVSQAAFEPGVEEVWLATGGGFADALTGAATAASSASPLLLVPGSLSESVADELQRLAPARVHLLGGRTAISRSVASAVAEVLPDTDVVRHEGVDRYGTAIAVAAATATAPAQVYLSTGSDYPDALSAGVLAARAPGPLLLTRPDALPDEVSDVIEELAPQEVRVLGGDAAVGTEVLSRFGR